MKNLIITLLFIATGTVVKAQATLDIRNSTPCDVEVSVRAHDINHLTCTLQSYLFKVNAYSGVQFVDVTDFNTSLPYLWQSGTGVTTGGQPTWDWDAVKFAGIPPFGTFGGQIGSTTACSNTTILTFPSSCTSGTGTSTVTANWAVSGGVVYVSFY